jgi:hypothetical protein
MARGKRRETSPVARRKEPFPTSPYLSLPLPTSPYLSLPLPTSPYLFLPLPTSPYLSLPLPTSPYLSLPLPTSPYLSLPLPTSPYLSLLLPTSPYLSLTLPTSPYISLPLPTSPYLSLHLPKPQTQAALENRKTIGGRIYRGEMQRWNEFQGWGFIQADPDLPLPAHVQARLCRPGSVYVRKADVAPGVRLQKGLLVMFQVFIDDQDVRACGLQLI